MSVWSCHQDFLNPDNVKQYPKYDTICELCQELYDSSEEVRCFHCGQKMCPVCGAEQVVNGYSFCEEKCRDEVITQAFNRMKEAEKTYRFWLGLED